MRAGGPAQFRVAYTTEPARYVAVFVRGPDPEGRRLACFAFDQREVDYPRWRGEGDEIVLFDAEFRSFYVIGGASADVEIVAHRDDQWPRVALMRVVREIAAAHVESHGALPIHGAAVRLGASAAILAGPKRSGKTSLLFHALLHSGTALVANDRVMLHRDVGAWRATGMPTVISIRKGTRLLFPDAFASQRDDPTLASLSADERARYTGGSKGRDDGALVLNPMQLGALAGVERAGTTELRAIVLPRVDPERIGLSLAKLTPDEAAERLPGALFRPASRLFYTRGREPASPGHAAAAETIAHLVRSVACFECILGADAYTSASRTAFSHQLFGSAA
ncbi:MAG TPA: hypothetical protein VHM01_01825 [Alphaproteobacteria bacterium]|nr:hypothetical protein [Alphaproteobacteria bacterium]